MIDKLPLIEDMERARTIAEQARILLRVPDAIILKYQHVFEAACGRLGFVEGEHFIAMRVSVLHAVRGPDGKLPEKFRVELDGMMQHFAGLDAGLADATTEV